MGHCVVGGDNFDFDSKLEVGPKATIPAGLVHNFVLQLAHYKSFSHSQTMRKWMQIGKSGRTDLRFDPFSQKGW